MHKYFNILICDVNIKAQGHYISYNQYLLDHYRSIELKYPRARVSFLFNREAKSHLSFKSEIAGKVSFIDLPGENTMYKRYMTVKKVKKFCVENRIDHLLFLDLDQYQLPLYIVRFRLNISGILFRPHHRIASSNQALSAKFITGLKKLRKRVAEKLFVKQSAIQNIFVLNDRDGVSLLNKIHHSSIFRYLPDPIFSYDGNQMKNVLIPGQSDVFRYLIFGSMSERKNITNIILAYDQIKLQRKTELLIVGPCSESYLVYLNDLIAGLITIDGLHKSIILRKEFVTNEQMNHYFSISDVCLLIYKDFFGSSGLLGRSALYNKRVIGPNTGLLRELIFDYKMGLIADPMDVQDIARSLAKIMKFNIDCSELQKFYENHSPDKFLGAISESVTL
jgi:glycosyltransferase involved in cell wall biosynthesis